MGKVAQPIRVAVTGGTASPGIGVTLHVLGRQRTLDRLDRAIAFARGERDRG
jgi:glutamyl-tRNA synthetase